MMRCKLLSKLPSVSNKTLSFCPLRQVYAEALALPECEAIHYTLVETRPAAAAATTTTTTTETSSSGAAEGEGDDGCDTHFPEIPASQYKVWSAAFPQRDAASGLRYHFLCYTRTDNNGSTATATNGATGADSGTGNSTSSSSAGNGGADVAPRLPPAIASRHEEQQYLDMIREVMEQGVYKGDRTGTGKRRKG
jgi:dihydrofolate reductase / thymidylate synthase